MVLGVLDLVVDPRTRKLMPNPASPETPMIDIFMAMSLNSYGGLNNSKLY